MTDAAKTADSVVSDLTRHLGGIFRYLLPGVLLVGGAGLAYPRWLDGFDLRSSAHLTVLAVVSIAAGNVWYALNRYGVHQCVDFVLWYYRRNGPAKTDKSISYIDDLGRYSYESLHRPDVSLRAQQHVALRASTVLLLLTVGELAFLFSWLHAPESVFAGQELACRIFGAVALALGVVQMIITRRIDYYVVRPPPDAA